MNMNRRETKTFLLVSVFVIAFLICAPLLQPFLVRPQTDFFTEMWLLGPNHDAENYPYNITSGENYSVFLDINNNLGVDASYVVQVKFRNLTQSAPDAFNHTPSSLPSIYNVTAFVAAGKTWEAPMVFSFNYEHFQNVSKIYFESVIFNDVVLPLDGSSIMWNYQRKVFFGNLIFELWKYDGSLGTFQYCEEYTDLKFSFVV